MLLTVGARERASGSEVISENFERIAASLH
jgi:hypothetical protein